MSIKDIASVTLPALSVNELIAELQEVVKRGYGDAPVCGIDLEQQGPRRQRPISSVWDMSTGKVLLTLEVKES